MRAVSFSNFRTVLFKCLSIIIEFYPSYITLLRSFLGSSGFCASDGTNHVFPFLTAPGIRSSAHSKDILLEDIPHNLDNSDVVK